MDCTISAGRLVAGLGLNGRGELGEQRVEIPVSRVCWGAVQQSNTHARHQWTHCHHREGGGAQPPRPLALV